MLPTGTVPADHYTDEAWDRLCQAREAIDRDAARDTAERATKNAVELAEANADQQAREAAGLQRQATMRARIEADMAGAMADLLQRVQMIESALRVRRLL